MTVDASGAPARAAWPPLARRLTIAAAVVSAGWFLFLVLWGEAPFTLTFDDAFYYFGIARNIVAGHGSTFDGINATNGYHPLWMGICLIPFALGIDITLLYVAITIALTYPILRHVGSVIPHDLGDPILNTSLLWWSSRRVPLTAAWWNAPMFFPAPNVMALSELLIGLLPITWVVQWLTHNPVAAYNVAFVV